MKKIYSEKNLLSKAQSTLDLRVNIVDHPLVRDSLALMRDQTTSMLDFRRSIKALSYHLIYAASSSLKEIDVEVSTPLAPISVSKIANQIVLIPVLRSGIGMLEPAQEIFPSAPVIFAGMARDEATAIPHWYYDLKLLPNLQGGEGVVFFVLDPMLATGGSAKETVSRIQSIYPKGTIHLVSMIASAAGIKMLNEQCPNLIITVAAIDDHLNERKYIVPGLGDAGDRQFDNI